MSRQNLRARSWRTAALGLALVLVFGACGQAAPGGTAATSAGPSQAVPKKGGTLTIVQPAEPFSFDSRIDPKMEGIEVVMNVLDPLINFDPATRKLVPSLAKSWTAAPDGLRYEFNLREGVKFSDGTPFSAADVLFTFDFLTGKQKGGAYVSQFEPFIDSVTSPDPSRIVIAMKRPFTDFPELLARLWATRILSKAAVEKAGKDFGTTTTLGTGPFMIKEWIKGDSVTLVRNPNYWGQAAYLDEVVYRRIPDGSARLIQAKSGQADIVYQPPLDQLAQAASDAKLSILSVEGNPIVFMRFNTSSPLFKDLKARQAVLYALDADKIRSAAYGDNATTARDFLPPWHWASDKDFSGLRPDADRAKTSLSAAGFTAAAPMTFNLTMNNESEFTQLGTLIQGQLKAFGIQANLKPLDPATLNDLELKKPAEYQASISRFLLPTGVTDDYMFKQYAGAGPLNRTYLNQPGGLQMPEIGKLLDEARVAPDRDSSKKLYRQVVDKLAQISIALPIAFKKNVNVINKRVHDLYVQGTDAELLREVWVD